jgi:hypothetical protein
VKIYEEQTDTYSLLHSYKTITLVFREYEILYHLGLWGQWPDFILEIMVLEIKKFTAQPTEPHTCTVTTAQHTVNKGSLPEQDLSWSYNCLTLI